MIEKFINKYGIDDRTCKTCLIKYKDCDCFLEYSNFKDDLIEHKCLSCKRNYQKMFDENLKKRFLRQTVFVIMMWISLFLYCEKVFTLINIWMIGKKFNETSLPETEDFSSNLCMKDINDAYHAHSKRICKYFEITNLLECHSLYV